MKNKFVSKIITTGLLLASIALWSSSAIAATNELLFVSNQDGDREIYTIKNKKDTSSLLQLTNNDRDDYQAIWSPDGKRIAFTSSRDKGNSEIYVMDADGTNQVNLSAHKAIEDTPQWSPDGNKLLFRSTRDGGLNLFVMNIDGTDLLQLTKGDSEKNAPVWSPNGKWIAYIQYTDRQKGDVYIIRADGVDRQIITDNPKFNDDIVAWSQDSKSLVYSSRRHKVFNIFKHNIDEKREVQLTNTKWNNTNPQWTPDGQKILFLSARDDGARSQIYIMNADGTSQQRLTFTGKEDADIHWSADGKRIAFASFRDGNFPNVYEMTFDGKEDSVIRLAEARGYQSQPLYRPVLSSK